MVWLHSDDEDGGVEIEMDNGDTSSNHDEQHGGDSEENDD